MISNKLNAILNEKNNLKIALENLGVDMTDVPFTEYHTKILDLSLSILNVELISDKEVYSPGEMVNLTATVTDEDNVPISGAFVQLCRDGISLGSEYSSITNSEGVVSFDCLFDDECSFYCIASKDNYITSTSTTIQLNRLGYVTDGLIVQYDTLLQTSGSTLVNQTGNTTYNGILQNTSVTSEGIVLNGSNTKCVTNLPQSSLTDGFTIEIVTSCTARNNYKGLIGYHGNYKGLLIQWVNNTLNVGIFEGETELIYVDSSTIPSNTAVYTFTYKSNDSLKLYINGVLQGTYSNPAPLSPLGNLILFQSYDGRDRYWQGVCKSVLIYNAPLTSEQVTNNYDVHNNRFNLI